MAMVKRAERIAELQAMIESAKAEIKQLQADDQSDKAKAAMSESRVDNEDGNLQERNTADAIAAYEADKKNERELTGERNEQGDFLQVPITVSKEEMNERVIDKDMRTDEESARRKFTGVEPVETVPSSQGGDLEMGGGRAKGEEVEPSEKTNGFKADEGGNMSVDEKDDFWKTQEGYNKAMEMYGQKPAFVPDEPTMIWNPEEQKYEKIKEEDKEQFEDLSTPSMSADIKALFG